MSPTVAKSRLEVARLERELELEKQRLAMTVRNCNHTWGPTVYAPIITEAHTLPGDPIGTMGVDWRGPVHVSRKEEKRWSRSCNVCGHIEYTRKEESTGTRPVF